MIDSIKIKGLITIQGVEFFEEGEKMKEKYSQTELFDEWYQEQVMFVPDKKNGKIKELERLYALLAEVPQLVDLVHSDLNKNLKPQKLTDKDNGHPGTVSADQALRSLILMFLYDWGYRDLEYNLTIAPIYRKFTHFYEKKIPDYTTIERTVKMISPETLVKINEEIVKLGIKKNVENGISVRQDSTVVETDIAYPVDAKLINDSIRVLTRQIEELEKISQELDYTDHTKRSKKRAFQIVMCKGKNADERRHELYRDLFRTMRDVKKDTKAIIRTIEQNESLMENSDVTKMLNQLKCSLEKAEIIYSQAYRRIIEKEHVPVREKIFSFFETHTDLICRGKTYSPAEFGHKVDFGAGSSGMIVRYEVLKGNPSDSEILERSAEDYIKLFGRVPKELATDKRYHSKENIEMLKGKGIEHVGLPKPGRLSSAVKIIQGSRWFKKLMRFRSGVEGIISTLLRVFGLKRCHWKGLESFKAYVGAGVMTYNLRLLAWLT